MQQRHKFPFNVLGLLKSEESVTRPTILVVDDNAAVRECLKLILENEGYDVISATSGATGFTLSLELRPDLILADLMMQQGTGINLIRQVRQTPDLSQTPVVAMTGFGSEFVSLAERAGASAVVRKPEDLGSVVTIINALLNRRAKTPTDY